ncbi:glyoxalase [Pradoshia eiseniae]|uniref:Glyoxalase n=1 Tax=Pradoshia eiseniae TaxID=2064768 RepID=A0A2S7MYJ9_9BACI|nr:VOC family protein [Pradoshia eiseniae]PQD94846.1 glyoxalase [Pradoshia eiseniae]
MRINHAAVFVEDLERAKEFYKRYFGAKENKKYHNPNTGLETYFLSFEGDVRLEIMKRPDTKENEKSLFQLGYAHLAFSVGSKNKVDELTNRLEQDGYTVLSGPRTTGDGYYESLILDSENNQIEIVE